jgi:hypothetical protein
VLAKKSGAAVSMGRVAPAPVVAVEPRPHRLIAKQGLQTGWQAGVWPKRRGVANQLERAAHQQQVDAHEMRVP